MDKYREILLATHIFAGAKPDFIKQLAAKVNVHKMLKGEVFVNEGDLCQELSIVATGQVLLQKYSADGDYVTLDLLAAKQCFGAEFIFSAEHHYTYAVEALTTTQILTIPKEAILSLLPENPEFLKNVLGFLCNNLQRKTRHMAALSQRSLRQKIAIYLLNLWKDQQEALAFVDRQVPNQPLTVNPKLVQQAYTCIRPSGFAPISNLANRNQRPEQIGCDNNSAGSLNNCACPLGNNLVASPDGASPCCLGVRPAYCQSRLAAQTLAVDAGQVVEFQASQVVICRLLAIPRPSFSRELINMEKDGLIKINGRKIELLDIEALEQGAFNN